MATSRVRCTVVEVGCDHATGAETQTSHDLLPWADPFIAQLVDRYRLRAALDDSLRFLESESSNLTFPNDRSVPADRSARFQRTRPGRLGLLFDGPHQWPNEG